MAISNPITIRRQAGGGGGLPSWVPAPGTFANVSLNRPVDVHPCPAGNCPYIGSSGLNAAFNLWTSGAIAPELGALGSYVCWGGGHAGGSGNNVFRWDISGRLWSSMGAPSLYGDSNVDTNGALPDGKPAAPHTYQTLGIRPSASGGGTYGSLISAGLPACDINGNGRFARWWQFNLNGATWSHFIDSSGIPAGALTQKCMVQEPNGNMWWFGGGDVNIRRVSLSGAITAYSVNINSDNYIVGGVIPGSRIIALHGILGSVQTRLYNLPNIEAGQTGSSAAKTISTTGTPGQADGSLEWVPEVGGFASIVWNSPSTIRWLKPSNVNDPWNSTWAWSSESFTGAGGATAAACQNGAHGRLKWVPAVKCLLWAPNVTNYMQAYRPAGT